LTDEPDYSLVGDAPRGHPDADWTADRERCPLCGSLLATADGWVWCFNHEHPTEDSWPVYVCLYELRVSW
jgi:hypothetical protein